MAGITALLGTDLSEAIAKFAPGWKVTKCGDDMEVGLFPELRGRKNVLVTHPLNQDIGCVISRAVQLPSGKRSVLGLLVGHDPRGDWDLIVKINGQQLLRKPIDMETTAVGWTEIAVDLSRYAGESVELELVNEPTGWRYEAAYWAEISLQSN